MYKPNLIVRQILATLLVIAAISTGIALLAATDNRPTTPKPTVTIETADTEYLGDVAFVENQYAEYLLATAAASRKPAETGETDMVETEEPAVEQVYTVKIAETTEEPTYTEPDYETTAANGIPPESYWDRMAACETGSNWAHYPFSDYSGGLGIYRGTWQTWGGNEFAPNAGQTSRANQIIVANRIATQGWQNGDTYQPPVGYSGWGCVNKGVGYP